MRNSISVKLLFGFVLVLATVGIAAGVTLLKFQEVKLASAEAQKQQRIREQAMQIASLAQRMFFLQNDFLSEETIDRDAILKSKMTNAEINRLLEGLKREKVDAIERRYLEELAADTSRMYETFYSGVVSAKLLYGSGRNLTSAERAKIARMQHESRKILFHINDLNDRLGRSFSGKLEKAEGQANDAWRTSWVTFQILFALGAVLCLFVVYYTHRSILRPVMELRDATSVISEGDLTRRIPVTGSNEFQQLADSFNRMTERLMEHQRRLIQVEKAAGIGRLAAGIAHEINNPLAVILGYAKMMLRDMPSDTPDYEALKSIEDEAHQCKRIVEGLLDLARPSSGGDETVDVDELIEEVMSLADILNRTKGVRVEKTINTQPVTLYAGSARLKQIAVNMLMNALEAVQGKPRPSVKIRAWFKRKSTTDGRSGELVLEFSDNGRGIDEDDQNRLFEPFFTTKPSGTGMGLAITYSIVSTFDGTISVNTEKGKGTTFTVRLPASM